MPDKTKTIKKQPNSSSSKKETKKEAKRNRFLRVAKRRTEKVLKAMSLLGNCGNRSNYDYTEAEAKKMMLAIARAFELLQSKFSESKESMESFDF